MAKFPGRYHMLPLQPCAALSVFARCVATTAGINLLAAEGAITIKGIGMRSEERRVGKERRCGWWLEHLKTKLLLLLLVTHYVKCLEAVKKPNPVAFNGM